MGTSGRLILTLALAGVLLLPPRSLASQCSLCHPKIIQPSGTPQNPAPHAGFTCLDCHSGAAKEEHTVRQARANCLACHSAEGEQVGRSAHAALGIPKKAASCVTCHGAHPGERRPKLQVACASCHATEVKDFEASNHGRALKAGSPDAPHCASCHGPIHGATVATESASPLHATRLADTCGRCHADAKLTAKYMFSVVRPLEAYRAGVHGRALNHRGNPAAACNDCHESHRILAAHDAASTVSRQNVPHTCGKCHGEIAQSYKQSIHGRAVAAGIRQAPSCVDCHGEHDIRGPAEPGSAISASNVSRLTCSRCHADERLAARFSLPSNRVSTYESTYHGLASRAGSPTVANCASCHGVHYILPSTDPRSSIHAQNLAATCGKCHPDAGQKFVQGPIHSTLAEAQGGLARYWVRKLYLWLIPITVGFMFFHNVLDFWRKTRRKLLHWQVTYIERLTLQQRIQHAVLGVSFIVLVVTGFALKFPESFWAAPLLTWEKSFGLRGFVHRVAGVVMIGVAVWHLLYLRWRKEGQRFLAELRPRLADLEEAASAIRHNLNLGGERPDPEKFGYVEKVEYWSLVWGATLMAATGIILWGHNFVMAHLPRWFYDVAEAVHYYEAILASLAIVIWHFYGVMADPEVYPMNMAWLTGKRPIVGPPVAPFPGRASRSA